MRFIWIVLCFSLIATSAWAQMDPNMNMGSKPGSTKFSQDMDTSMKVMDKGMASAPMTGNVDHDFASMMVPHHQGAIDMAKGELEYGKDPEMRALAKSIIAAQKVEIKQMNKWLETTGAAKDGK